MLRLSAYLLISYRSYIPYPLEMSGSLRFSDVFREHRNAASTRDYDDCMVSKYVAKFTF